MRGRPLGLKHCATVTVRSPYGHRTITVRSPYGHHLENKAFPEVRIKGFETVTLCLFSCALKCFVFQVVTVR